MEVDNLIDIKYKNIKSVIDFARFQDDWQKWDAARKLNLSFATASNIINLLMNCGLLEQVPLKMKAIGRSPKGYRLVADRFVMAAIDIHMPQEVVLSLVDLRRRCFAKRVCENMDTTNIDGFIGCLKREYFDFVKASGMLGDRVIGATAIIPGTYDTNTCMVVGTSNKLFLHQPLLKMLSAALEVPVTLENDANLAAFSKANELGLKHLLYLYCGVGLGMGAVINGEILSGANGFSVEISHAPFGRLGRKCRFCGHTDCLQDDVSRLGFVSKFQGKLVSEESYSPAMWNTFLAALNAGDKQAQNAAYDNAHVLGRALSTAASILRPETVIIGGLNRSLFEIMHPIIEDEINSREYYSETIKVYFDEGFRKSTAIGAAESTYRRWFFDMEEDAVQTTT